MYSNRALLKKAREELRGLPTKERNALFYDGIGPGDSYVGFWRMVNSYRHRVKSIQAILSIDEAKPEKERMPPSKRRELEKNERYYSEEIKDIYGRVLGCEKPKLQSIMLQGDPSNPMQMEVSLEGLSDEELKVLARILPKLGGATAAAPITGSIRHGKRRT